MAVSLLASTIPSLNARSSSNSSRHPSLPANQIFSSGFRRIRIGKRGISSSSPTRISHVVAAKKQTFNSFDEMLATSDKPVLVDFYATWCGPCQFMVPILNEVSAVLKDRIQFIKIDTEKYPVIADKYKIEALPTFIIFKDGKPCDRFEGALNADQLIQRIEESLKVKQ